jgi:tetratricopeptide (TPR) repeat protein
MLDKTIVICFIFLQTVFCSFAQQKPLPIGFPSECPTYQPELTKAIHLTPRHMNADSLVKQAQQIMLLRNKENVLKTIEILENAVALDSTNAQVYYQLSDVYGLAPRYTTMLRKTGDEKSLAYFLKGFSLNPKAADGLGRMANLKIEYQNDYACAKDILKRVLKSDPKNAWIQFEYAILLASKNKFSEAYKHRVVALKNADSLTRLRILNNSARMRFMAHDYNWVIKHCDSLITSYYPKKNWLAHFYKGLALAQQGKYDQALAQQKLATPSLEGDAGGVANLARSYILAGDIKNGKQALQELLARYERGENVVNYQIAGVYEALGDFDNSFIWLNRDVEGGDDIHGWLLWLNHDPRWNRIRSDARFKELTIKAGL